MSKPKKKIEDLDLKKTIVISLDGVLRTIQDKFDRYGEKQWDRCTSLAHAYIRIAEHWRDIFTEFEFKAIKINLGVLMDDLAKSQGYAVMGAEKRAEVY